MRKNYKIVLTIIFTLLCVCQLEAQTGAPAGTKPAETAKFPYVGMITGDQVYVRAGPAQVYYPSGYVNKGEKVVVHKEMFGWAKVEPTKNCFSFIAKEYVDLLENSTEVTPPSTEGAAVRHVLTVKGMVKTDHVRVRAGSIKVAPEKADEQQTLLNQGDVVEIIGEQDNYYKIACPPKCYFWVSLDFIERSKEPLTAVTEKNITAPKPEATTTETVAATTETAVQQTLVVAPEKPAAPVLSALDIDRRDYDLVAKMMQDQMNKPIQERDFTKINQTLDAIIKRTESSSIKTASESLSRQVRRADMALQIWKQSKAQDEQLKMTLAKIEDKVQTTYAVNAPPEKRLQDIVVKGRLANSSVFTSNNKNRRFLVMDDMERISYYAIATRPGLDLRQWIGKRVSLIGKATYDAYSNIRLIHVTSIVELPASLDK